VAESEHSDAPGTVGTDDAAVAAGAMDSAHHVNERCGQAQATVNVTIGRRGHWHDRRNQILCKHNIKIQLCDTQHADAFTNGWTSGNLACARESRKC
jgi:hypothetical protein